MDITDFIGKAIAYYREEKDWSTVQLAEKSGLSQGSISLYENGKRNPSEDALQRIAQALGITIKLITERAEQFARNEQNKVSEIHSKYESRSDYDRVRQIDRIYRYSDFVFELNSDVFLSINTRVHDLVGMSHYQFQNKGPMSIKSQMYQDRTSLISHLTEKVFADFLRDHKEEIAYRIENELQNLNMDAYQLITELRKK